MMTRRYFMHRLNLAVAGGSLCFRPLHTAAEQPPETTRIRLVGSTGICVAPQYVADDLLRTEGFKDVEYVPATWGIPAAKAVGSGAVDITMNFVAPTLMRVDAGDPILLLAGVHVGCFELFGTERVRSVRDLKGKTVAVQALEFSQHIYLSSMAAYVGLDPHKDIKWAIHPSDEAMRLLADGKIEAFLGLPPDPQELRARRIGHVVVNSAVDRPWAQYFCCIAAGNREFVRRNPVATKRALRAILKASDICALEPDRVARALVEKGYAKSHDYALQTMKEVPYRNKWREYDPEDTARFYALRLREVGMITANPQKVITQGSDWSFLAELKKELKG